MQSFSGFTDSPCVFRSHDLLPRTFLPILLLLPMSIQPFFRACPLGLVDTFIVVLCDRGVVGERVDEDLGDPVLLAEVEMFFTRGSGLLAGEFFGTVVLGNLLLVLY